MLFLKKAVATGLVFAMMMGSGTAAFAQGNNKNHDKRDDKRDDIRVDIHLTFNDLKNAEWAMRYIASLASKRVFEGYEDGTFKPQNTVSRIEAITAAVRLMGLRTQAESPAEMSTKLNFKDANKIPAWAIGYVAVALENDLFTETDDMVQPQKDGDRLWATTLLVKALKLDAQAKAKMNTTLPFKDAKQIPAGSVGYVAVAIEKGLVDGFEDNTFRPNQPVTRAQLAALLDRTGGQLPNQGNSTITGTVSTPVSNNILSITSSGVTSAYILHPDVFIYRNGAKVNASALLPGDEVRVSTFNNQIVFIEVTRSVQSIPLTSTGTVNAVVTNNTLTLTNAGTTTSLLLHPDVIIYRNGVRANASDLKIGDIVNIRTFDNRVIYIEVTSPVLPITSSGTIITTVSNNVLKVASSGMATDYPLDPNVIIYRNGVRANAADLKVGDEVTINTSDNKAIYIVVTKMIDAGQPFALVGKLNSTTLNAQGGIATISITQTINSIEQTTYYNVSPSVTLNGNLSLFLVGHLIQLNGNNSLVTSIIIIN
ncbi:S-layer homology domain-containing protein [Paenibacillus sp. yr247]|uniref:S-layer homology domain-containing protein n=1 Tax=Paenibacillus sp. yr247 TaxID=1761880 RepID=UPI00087EAC69|nr:S-layer homology domain-containing protein [Paenibacillus sp. yr247]SDN66880.1 S-layer homology domain-containing protein [Paenibacillus sp. yr247]